MTISEILDINLLITVSMYMMVFSFGSFSLLIEKSKKTKYKAIIIPIIIIGTSHIFDNGIQIFKLTLLAESILLIFLLLLLLVKKEINLFLSSIIAFTLAYIINSQNIASFIVKFEFLNFIIAFLIICSLYLLVYKSKNEFDNYIKSFIFNILANGLLFFSSITSVIYFSTFLKILFFLLLFNSVRQEEKPKLEKLQKKLKTLEKDFDDEVKKKVNTSLFYLELSKEKMSSLAKIDKMTKVYNKETIVDMIKSSITDKSVGVFSLLIFDIDNFKSINDTEGHIVGDKCIVQVANIAKDVIRNDDKLGRYGGDEFFVLLPNANIKTAFNVAERLRAKIEDESDPKYTVSIGISNYPKNGETFKELLVHADDGLYISKNKGRNRVSYKE